MTRTHYVTAAFIAIISFVFGAGCMGLAWATIVGENCASMVR